MRTKGILLGIALAVGALASGCAPVIQSGLPDPQLTARDKQMMALAEPDEWRIPTQPQHGRVSNHEKPGTIIVDTGHELSLLRPASWRGDPVSDRERRRIYGMDRPRRRSAR